jgi:hypothetical protein
VENGERCSTGGEGNCFDRETSRGRVEGDRDLEESSVELVLLNCFCAIPRFPIREEMVCKGVREQRAGKRDCEMTNQDLEVRIGLVRRGEESMLWGGVVKKSSYYLHGARRTRGWSGCCWRRGKEEPVFGNQ